MKPILHYLLILLLVLGPVGWLNAQHRAVYLNLKDVQPDAVRKQFVFRYRLSNIAPKDSLSVELIRNSRDTFRLKTVYGDVGTVLTDGKNKKIYWDPVADRQRIDSSSVKISFVVKTVSGQGLTRWQAIRLGRWTVGAGLTIYTLVEGINILKKVSSYNDKNNNDKEPPNSTADKKILDDERTNIQHQQRNFYQMAASSATAILINLAWSAIQARHKMKPYKTKPTKLSITGENHSVGVAYKL